MKQKELEKKNTHTHTQKSKVVKRGKRKEGNSLGSSNFGADVGVVLFIKLGQTKFRNLKGKVPVRDLISLEQFSVLIPHARKLDLFFYAKHIFCIRDHSNFNQPPARPEIDV